MNVFTLKKKKSTKLLQSWSIWRVRLKIGIPERELNE